MATKINLISNALILIGDTPINSLTGGERRQQVASNLYDNIVQAELAKHRWGFARRKAQLSKLTAAPIEEWKTAYQLPTDLLSLIKLSITTSYQIYGSKVYTNVSGALYCDYIANVDESEWPVYFAKMIEYALASDFAASIRDDSSAQQEMNAKYINQSRMARATDSQQHPQTPIVDKPFIDVRF